MLTLFWIPTILTSTGLALGLAGAAAPGGGPEDRKVFEVYPIGTVHKKDGKCWLAIDAPYEDGLLGLDGFSHVQVFWWFDKNDTPVKRRILRVHPRGNRSNPLTGVFATRAPVRPNLIALTTCRIVSVDGRRVTVDKIDAFDGTPILDLKPYVPAIDAAADFRVPDWAGPPRDK
jgi:tRNA-Thr(GGU) m(6)t(6)A37 methyltransferase TsaA